MDAFLLNKPAVEIVVIDVVEEQTAAEDADAGVASAEPIAASIVDATRMGLLKFDAAEIGDQQAVATPQNGLVAEQQN